MIHPTAKDTLIGRRRLLAAAGAVAACGLAFSAHAQPTWKPAMPVRIVVPFPPGGAADILARFIAPHMSERLGQPVIVENRAGATGSIGSAYVHGAPADGTVLLLGLSDAVSIFPHVSKSRVDYTKLEPVAGLASSAFAVVGRPDLPANNLLELLALMKKQSLSYASAGLGSSPQMMAIAFAREAKVDINKLLHVPFTGMTPALQAVMGKQVDFGVFAVGGSAQYTSRLKFFGVTSETRVQGLTDVPTLTEQGLPMVGGIWLGLLAPPKTPAAVTAILSNAVAEIVSRKDYRDKLDQLGMTSMVGSQADFSKYYQSEYRKWEQLVREADVKLE